MKSYEINASYWRRLLGFLLDLIIADLFILGWWDLFLFTKFDVGGYTEVYQLVLGNPRLALMFSIITFIMTVLCLSYFMIFQWMYRQTPGMMIFSVFVKPLTTKLSVWQLLIRNIFLVPFFPFSLLWLIDPIHLFFSKEGQRWTEKLSKTKVMQFYKPK